MPRWVAINDGDTIKVRCDDAPQMTVRLASIDAPEKRQAFGRVSRQHLADLCFHQMATVRPTARDRYGRTVADVECSGEDAGAAQVRAGLAWVYVKYAPKDSPLFALEAAAHAAGAGLWAQDGVPPWVWRKLPADMR